MVVENSFLTPTQYFAMPGNTVLKNVRLVGNIVVLGSRKITVEASSYLRDVILVAPEIYIKSGTEGVFQAIAEKKITIGKRCKLKYPSALIISEVGESHEAYRSNENRLSILEGTTVKGIVAFLGAEKNQNYKPQLWLDENTLVLGEVYCEKNLSCLGEVHGSVYTRAFVVQKNGSIYQNHLLDAVINSENLPDEFAGLQLKGRSKRIVKWFILKKIKASTLMETMVATVLIVVIFMIASMLLNSIFSNAIKGNKNFVKEYLTELEYKVENQRIEIPFYDDFNDWEIAVVKNKKGTSYMLTAVHKETNEKIAIEIQE